MAGRPLSSKFPFCRTKLTSAEAWVLLPVAVRCCRWKAHQKQILFVLGDLVRGQGEGCCSGPPSPLGDAHQPAAGAWVVGGGGGRWDPSVLSSLPLEEWGRAAPVGGEGASNFQSSCHTSHTEPLIGPVAT